ncbi:hypothetical protein M758_UG042300 [Ceratodon purpureus]|nr:hypothetical protein M758_UG042300 [Ceratodon purpureus]
MSSVLSQEGHCNCLIQFQQGLTTGSPIPCRATLPRGLLPRCKSAHRRVTSIPIVCDFNEGE